MGQHKPTAVPTSIPQAAQPGDPGKQDESVIRPNEQQASEQVVSIRSLPPVDTRRDLVDYSGIGLTLLLIVVAIWQIILLKRTVKATEVAAAAAGRSADVARDALHIADRAFVSVGTPKHISFATEPLGIRPDFTMVIRNSGRTPARVTDIDLVSKRMPGVLPASPSYTGATPVDHTQSILPAGGRLLVNPQLNLISSDILRDLDEGKLHWYVFGHVDYIDTFGGRHRCGYGFKLIKRGSERMFIQIRPPGYNYDRPRTEGEGKDWDANPSATKVT